MEKFNNDNEKINVASKECNCCFEFSSNADGSNMDNYSLTSPGKPLLLLHCYGKSDPLRLRMLIARGGKIVQRLKSVGSGPDLLR